jgi:hypothetical protein
MSKNMILNKVVVVLLTSILLISVRDNIAQSIQNFNPPDINRTWVIQKIDLITDPSLIEPSDTMDLLNLFSIEIWSLAEGKYFAFKENGALETNIHINDIHLSREMEDFAKVAHKFEFRYKFDPDLVVITYVEHKLIYESPVKVCSLNTNQMIWDLGGLLKVTLISDKK